MTLILEFERKLIFYRPGILRYAMRLVGGPRAAIRNDSTRRQHLSQALKQGWAAARAERAALLRLQAFAASDAAAGLTDAATLNRTRLQ